MKRSIRFSEMIDRIIVNQANAACDSLAEVNCTHISEKTRELWKERYIEQRRDLVSLIAISPYLCVKNERLRSDNAFDPPEQLNIQKIEVMMAREAAISKNPTAEPVVEIILNDLSDETKPEPDSKKEPA